MTSDTLLVNVKDRAAIPPAQVGVTDAKLLNAASEELIAYVLPLLDSSNEEYFTTSTDIPVVASQTGYDMPGRAAGGAIRALKFVDASGVECPEPMQRIELADIGRYASLGSSQPLGFYFTATQIVVLPAPSASSGSFRIYYARRPGSLVNGTSVCTVTSLTDTVLTCTGGVTTSIFAVGQQIDVVSPNAPFKMKSQDISITGSNATTITTAGGFTAAGVAVGDYVTLAGTSYVPQIPLEWHSLLELRTCARAFSMLGDMSGIQECLGAAAQLERRLMGLSQPRAQGNSRRINAWRT